MKGVISPTEALIAILNGIHIAEFNRRYIDVGDIVSANPAALTAPTSRLLRSGVCDRKAAGQLMAGIFWAVKHLSLRHCQSQRERETIDPAVGGKLVLRLMFITFINSFDGFTYSANLFLYNT